MKLETLPVSITTHITIRDLDTGEVLREGKNAIHQENMSVALATALARGSNYFVSEIHFGNGATIVETDGNVSYRLPNVAGVDADLYNDKFFRVVDSSDINNPNFAENNVTVVHPKGAVYADTVITATLDYTDPLASDSVFNIINSTENSLDATTTIDGEMVFDEIALKTRGTNGLNTGKLLTHFIFHPVEKGTNQRIQIVYQLRVQAG